MGKLNILQHKSEKNRERVRQDEEKARLEEEKKAQRALEADREARLDLMRRKAHAKREITGGPADVSQTSLTLAEEPGEAPQGHINFFAELEAAAGKAQGVNAEYEAEKKAEKEKYEKQFTWYLGETRDGKKEVPWYATKDLKAPSPPPKPAGRRGKKEKEDMLKEMDDPLSSISKYLEAKDKDKTKKSSRSKPRTSSSSSSSSLERLRAERLAREAAERKRAEAVLHPEQDQRMRGKEEEDQRMRGKEKEDQRMRGKEKEDQRMRGKEKEDQKMREKAKGRNREGHGRNGKKRGGMGFLGFHGLSRIEEIV
ncbi:Leukocyte receptor cluster member 1 [Borealophlyctis nickersoniae]|nr:Leukocyte receptor cluster member 1 [Borealophlyctis nickersoniae]